MFDLFKLNYQNIMKGFKLFLKLNNDNFRLLENIYTYLREDKCISLVE